MDPQVVVTDSFLMSTASIGPFQPDDLLAFWQKGVEETNYLKRFQYRIDLWAGKDRKASLYKLVNPNRTANHNHTISTNNLEIPRKVPLPNVESGSLVFFGDVFELYCFPPQIHGSFVQTVQVCLLLNGATTLNVSHTS